MPRSLVAIPTAILLAAVAGQGVLQACGDKFFLIGRVERFSKAYAAVYPGRIVIYTAGSTRVSQDLQDKRLQKQMNQAGHRVLVARTPGELSRVLDGGAVDIILASVPQAIDLAPQIAAAASRPEVLPVAGSGEPADPGALPFDHMLKASDGIIGFLNRIEKVMESRASHAGRGTR